MGCSEAAMQSLDFFLFFLIGSQRMVSLTSNFLQKNLSSGMKVKYLKGSYSNSPRAVVSCKSNSKDVQYNTILYLV